MPVESMRRFIARLLNSGGHLRTAVPLLQQSDEAAVDRIWTAVDDGGRLRTRKRPMSTERLSNRQSTTGSANNLAPPNSSSLPGRPRPATSQPPRPPSSPSRPPPPPPLPTPPTQP